MLRMEFGGKSPPSQSPESLAATLTYDSNNEKYPI